jgi:hypothetical protein
LTYDFEVYADAGLTSLVTSVSGIEPDVPTTGWMVDVPLDEDNQFFWQSRTYDGYEFSEFTNPGSFWVNAVNQAPSAFDLTSPANGSMVSEALPTLSWTASSDPDPADEIDYTLWVATDPGFGTYTEVTGIQSASVPFPFPTQPAETYFWQVKAIDLDGAETWSSQTFSFQTEGAGCCQVRGDANHDGQGPDISDLVYLVSYMFSGGPAPECIEETDANGSGGNPDITDLIYLVEYMFQAGPPPVPCP